MRRVRSVSFVRVEVILEIILQVQLEIIEFRVRCFARSKIAFHIIHFPPVTSPKLSRCEVR
jgi:hypothetical protein